MTEKFKNLDENKKQRILNAALQEFAENGFEKASTNKIVKRAGIGKGMLFYYFNNKKDLYDFLIDYSLDIITDQYLNHLDTKEPDFIERFNQASQLKMKCFTENPHVFNFLGNLFTGSETELSANYQKRYQQLQELGYSKLYDNIDKTLFRNDVDVNKAYQLIKWTIDGYQNDLVNRIKGKNLTVIDFESYWEEFNDYLEVLKTIFYRKR